MIEAENKLMQIMMDLATNTMNVSTLTVDVDALVVATNDESTAIALI